MIICSAFVLGKTGIARYERGMMPPLSIPAPTAPHPVTVLMGPTGSGKSALALRIAAARPTVIINADAMQMVAELRVLTARPSATEEAQAEHALYGVVPAATPTSVARWLEMVVPCIRAAWAAGKAPLLVGGTGMYVNALRAGIAPIPPIPEEVRAAVRAAPTDALYAELTATDPALAAQLKPADTQRIMRGVEVLRATGESLLTWQEKGNTPLIPEAEFTSYYMAIAREVAYARIDARFDQMMAQGALEEVQALLALDLPPDAPILRACGVPELSAYLRGDWTLDEARTKAQQHTRNYAKRQMTWIRNQMPEAIPVTADGEAPCKF